MARHGQRGLVLWAGGLAALAVLAGGQRLLDAGRLRGAGPEADATWIWAADTALENGPEAFFAVRDFELPFAPRRAELAILADEEYWAILNDAPVGAGGYSLGAPFDRYDVAALLRRGANRLLVELRSARGVGGMLARLEVAGAGAGESLVLVSDGEWLIVRRHQRGLARPGEPLPEALPPRIWGTPPIGRWGLPAPGALQPRLDELRTTRRAVVPRRYRPGGSQGGRGWRRFEPKRRAPEPLGAWATFDFGAEIVAYLSLGFLPGEGQRGLLWTGREPLASTLGVDPRLDPPDAVVLAPPGRTWWTDVRPRRFRYVHVLGVDGLTLLEAYPVDPERAAPLVAVGSMPPGVWGLRAPRSVTPIEDEVWRELESVAGVGGG